MKFLIVVFFVFCTWVTGFGQSLATKNIVIVTLDGYRWREVFQGADETILSRATNDTTLLNQFGGASQEERRRKLMPFFWNEVVRHGQLYGNRKYKNNMNVTNRSFYSYSGYSEMFVGFADKRVKNNTPKTNPNFTVLEVINRHPDYQKRVAAFSTWQVMEHILREEKSGIPVNSGDDKAMGPITKHERVLNILSDSVQNPNGNRYDKFTFQYAMEYMKRERPKVVFISLDETDAYAHSGDYLSYLKAAHETDQLIGKLWSWIQSQSDYKDQTTLIVGTDHGRGRGKKTWKDHRLLYRGSSQVWLAVMGPDTPAQGEMKLKMHLKQNQIAKTVAAFLNVPYYNVVPVGHAIPTVFNPGIKQQGDQLFSKE